jgi:methyltransferase
VKILLGQWQVAGLQLLNVYIAARILEIIASALRTRAARLERGVRPPPEPWFPGFIFLHALVFLGSGATLILRGNIVPIPLLFSAMGTLVIAMLLRGWVFFALRNRWNVRVVDPGDIVTTGPYRFIRHPNYLAVILEVAALPLVLGAWEVALLGSIANGILLSWRIPFEERALSRAHPTYREVMMARPRFIPGLRPRRAPAASHSTRPL